jgi:type II secretory pathway pseudopilin PulG
MNRSPHRFVPCDHPRPRFRGFTIIEMLVIIGILVVLIGLLLPALSGARSRGKKTEELNALRQYHLAWTMYSNSADDKLLPGYLDQATQTAWQVNIRFPNKQVIPHNISAPFTWRLASYLNYSHDLIHGYADEAETDMSGNDLSEAEEVAYEPAFGYNAIYLGGWYEGSSFSGLPAPRFYERGVVATSQSHLARAQNLVVFCSSSVQPAGFYRKWSNSTPGSHYVTPPIVAMTQRWISAGLALVSAAPSGTQPAFTQVQVDATEVAAPVESSTIRVVDDTTSPHTSIPIGRYTSHVAVCFADGGTSSQMPGALFDQRMWIPRATPVDFKHDP